MDATSRMGIQDTDAKLLSYIAVIGLEEHSTLLNILNGNNNSKSK